MRTVAADVLLWAGVALLLLCAAGMLAMRSAYDRLHYTSGASWGVLLIAIAILVRESWSIIGDKALAIAFLLAICSPALAHATARAGRIRERGAWNARAAEQKRRLR
jgi:multicomponent Na+:H+ antiporter subunit G